MNGMTRIAVITLVAGLSLAHPASVMAQPASPQPRESDAMFDALDFAMQQERDRRFQAVATPLFCTAMICASIVVGSLILSRSIRAHGNKSGSQPT